MVKDDCAVSGGSVDPGRGIVVGIFAAAVLKLLQAGWAPEVPVLGGPEPARSYALLSPPHRASMSGARGAQKPPAKEDEHG